MIDTRKQERDLWILVEEKGQRLKSFCAAVLYEMGHLKTGHNNSSYGKLLKGFGGGRDQLDIKLKEHIGHVLL